MTATAAEPLAEPLPPVAALPVPEPVPDGGMTERQQELLARAESLPKPTVGWTLKLTTFLADFLMQTVGQAAQPGPTGAPPEDRAVLLRVVAALDEPKLKDLGKILLCDQSLELADEDLDLVWITAALARWSEQVNLALIVKNVRRVALALQ
jgi:hypothetical protein